MKLPKGLAIPDFSKLSRRERLLAAGGVLVVSMVLLDRVVLAPWWQHTQRVRREIDKLEASIWTAQQVIARRPQITAEVDAYRDYLQRQADGVLDMASFLREIEALGKESSVVLGEVKPLQEAGEAGSQGPTLDVRCSGALPQWIHFLYLLENSPLLIDVQRATLARSEAGGGLLEGSVRLGSAVMRQAAPTARAPEKRGEAG